MSRHGYTYDHDDPLVTGRWIGALNSAVRGKRGQAFLKYLDDALDTMEEKELFPGSFSTPNGEFCALGILGKYKGIPVDDLGGDNHEDYECEPERVAERFGIAESLACEVMYLNDEGLVQEDKHVFVTICGPMRTHWPHYEKHSRWVKIPVKDAPSMRWQAMRKWVDKKRAALQAAKGGEDNVG